MEIFVFLLCSVSIFQFGNAGPVHVASHGYGSEDFQNCWIHIYRNPDQDWNYMGLNYPISLPATNIDTDINICESSIWSNYVILHKYVACSAYFLVSPKRWKTQWNRLELLPLFLILMSIFVRTMADSSSVPWWSWFFDYLAWQHDRLQFEISRRLSTCGI